MKTDPEQGTEPEPEPKPETDPEQEAVEPPEAAATPPAETDQGIVRYHGRAAMVLVVIAFLIALLIKTFFLQAFFIPSGSMEPTLVPGDRVLVQKVSYYIARPPSGGDI